MTASGGGVISAAISGRFTEIKSRVEMEGWRQGWCEGWRRRRLESIVEPLVLKTGDRHSNTVKIVIASCSWIIMGPQKVWYNTTALPHQKRVRLTLKWWSASAPLIDAKCIRQDVVAVMTVLHSYGDYILQQIARCFFMSSASCTLTGLHWLKLPRIE